MCLTTVTWAAVIEISIKIKNKNNKKGSKGSRKTVGNSSGGKKKKCREPYGTNI